MKFWIIGAFAGPIAIAFVIASAGSFFVADEDAGGETRIEVCEFERDEMVQDYSSFCFVDVKKNSNSKIDMAKIDDWYDVVANVGVKGPNGSILKQARVIFRRCTIERIFDAEKLSGARRIEGCWRIGVVAEPSRIRRLNDLESWIYGNVSLVPSVSNTIPFFDIDDPGLSTHRKVWVAKRNIPSGRSLSRDNVTLEYREIESLKAWRCVFEDRDLSGLRAMRHCDKGSIVAACASMPLVSFPIYTQHSYVNADYSRHDFDSGYGAEGSQIRAGTHVDVVGLFGEGQKRIIEGVPTKKIVARNVRIYEIGNPYPETTESDETSVCLTVGELEENQISAAKKMKRGNFWLVPTGTASYPDLFRVPEFLKAYVTVHGRRWYGNKKVWVANYNLEPDEMLDEFNVRRLSIPSEIADQMVVEGSENTMFGKRVLQAVNQSEIVSVDMVVPESANKNSSQKLSNQHVHDTE